MHEYTDDQVTPPSIAYGESGWGGPSYFEHAAIHADGCVFTQVDFPVFIPRISEPTRSLLLTRFLIVLDDLRKTCGDTRGQLCKVFAHWARNGSRPSVSVDCTYTLTVKFMSARKIPVFGQHDVLFSENSAWLESRAKRLERSQLPHRRWESWSRIFISISPSMKVILGQVGNRPLDVNNHDTKSPMWVIAAPTTSFWHNCHNNRARHPVTRVSREGSHPSKNEAAWLPWRIC